MEAYPDQSGHITVPSTPSLPERRVVVVLGMHRSGTSLVAGCLQQMGVDFGPRLMPPDANNPRGYFEHNDVVNLHDRLLLALDRSWDEPALLPADWWLDADRLDPYRRQVLEVLRRDFPSAPLWGLKDPRLCLLLPWWESIWPELNSRPLFVLVRRNPAEVASSLARRERMSPEKAYLLWLRHTLQAEFWTRGQSRILVDFGDFLRDENAALAPIRSELGGVQGESAPARRLVDPGLGASTLPSEKLPSWVKAADEAILEGGLGDERAMRLELDEVARQLSTGEFLLLPRTEGVIADLRQQLQMSRKQARWYEAEWQKARARAEDFKLRMEGLKSSKPRAK